MRLTDYLSDVVRPDDDGTNVRRGRVAPVRPVSGEIEGPIGDSFEVPHEAAAPRDAVAVARARVRDFA